MDITLDYYEFLGLYISPDWMYVYDPSSQQLYQQVSPGNYQPVSSNPFGGYGNLPTPSGYQSFPQTQAPTAPVYVNPPRPGITFAPTIIRQTGTSTQTTSTAPVVAPPAPPAPPSGIYQPAPAPRTTTAAPTTTGTQAAPPPRLAQPKAAPGSGGTVKMKTDPDPNNGYWYAYNLMGYWNEFPDRNQFYQASYPVKKVRMEDGRPWPYGILAIYQGRDARKNEYILLYESTDFEWAWTKYGDKIKAAQVYPVPPF